MCAARTTKSRLAEPATRIMREDSHTAGDPSRGRGRGFRRRQVFGRGGTRQRTIGAATSEFFRRSDCLESTHEPEVDARRAAILRYRPIGRLVREIYPAGGGGALPGPDGQERLARPRWPGRPAVRTGTGHVLQGPG